MGATCTKERAKAWRKRATNHAQNATSMYLHVTTARGITKRKGMVGVICGGGAARTARCRVKRGRWVRRRGGRERQNHTVRRQRERIKMKTAQQTPTSSRRHGNQQTRGHAAARHALPRHQHATIMAITNVVAAQVNATLGIYIGEKMVTKTVSPGCTGTGPALRLDWVRYV